MWSSTNSGKWILSTCLRTAQKKEIIKAYRKLAQQWHPDNFQDPEEKKRAEKKFIDIAQAKEVLTDPGKKFVLKAHSSEQLLTHYLVYIVT